MVKRIFAVAFISAALAMTACGGGNNTNDDGTETDIIIGEDTTNPDVVVNPDAVDRDTVGVDTITPEDTVVPVDTVIPEDTVVPVDTVVPEDTNLLDVPEDTTVATCTGACEYGTDDLWCLEDGTTICYCADTNAWTPYVCAEICASNNMVGDQCGEVEGSPNCMCEYDCTQTALTTAQCEDLSYTPCTCAATDPCSWQGDGYCDNYCATVYPEDFFTEPDDCNCTGSCVAEEFSGFCDNDGNPCACVGSVKTTESCADYCTGLGAEVDPEEPCYAYSGVAYCNCANFDCTDSGKVAAQCGAEIYTPCTCGVADPCEWANDGQYCDVESCNTMFPDQENFDDSATDCVQ